MTSRLTLYLDADGALHPNDVWVVLGRGIELRGPGELFMHCHALEAALQPFDIDIVLSTSWVRAIGYAATRERLTPGLRDRVIGATYEPKHTPGWSYMTRYQQIIAHVRRHGIVRWLAIDDDVADWPAHERHRVISPQPLVGLAPVDLELLVRRLKAMT